MLNFFYHNCLSLLLIRPQQLCNKGGVRCQNRTCTIYCTYSNAFRPLLNDGWLHLTSKMCLNLCFRDCYYSTVRQQCKTKTGCSRLICGLYLNDLKSSTNSMKLIVLSEIMRFWKPLKQPLPRPCHDLLLHALRPTEKRKKIS